ncbi:enolase-phosphatase E1 [Planctomycetota bacterium]|nr:enolase-phosphatase E1 [Planctomycetota bacterium]
MTAVILLDIEGTTTPISFVTDVLFPYAAAAIPSFIAAHHQRPEVAAAIALIAKDANPEERSQHQSPSDLALAVVRRQMAGDIKATGLKQLQGLVWQHGYESGVVRGQVYADVPAQFRAWTAAGKKVAIYSSGSVLAQKLIFGYSDAGDLRPYITAYFDTTTGPKREAASYTAIAASLGVAPSEITFATDQPGEAHAAAAAGCNAVVLMRPGNAPLPANLPFPVHGDLRVL